MSLFIHNGTNESYSTASTYRVYRAPEPELVAYADCSNCGAPSQQLNHPCRYCKSGQRKLPKQLEDTWFSNAKVVMGALK